jgi:acyl-coenzyme A thioesterase PaaI-like protein
VGAGDGRRGRGVAVTSRFEADTAVEQVEADRFTAEVRAGWRVTGDTAPNGGYLMALAGRAMAVRAERPDPVTVTAHFLAPPALGPVEIVTELVRAGRRLRTVGARLLQDGRECVRLLGAFDDLGAAAGPTDVRLTPPPWPPVEELPDTPTEGPGFTAPEIFHRLRHRMPRAHLGWTVGRPADAGVTGGWCQWPDAEAVDTLGLLFVADAYPPAVFDLAAASPTWAPTIELTVQVRARPDPGWLAARFVTRALTAGTFEEDGDVWDASGRLVAISRQTALVGRTAGGGSGG